MIQRKKRLLGICFLSVTVILIMFIIICFSGQNSLNSNDLSKGLTGSLLRMIGIEPTKETLLLLNWWIRKAAHFTLYCILGISLSTLCLFINSIPYRGVFYSCLIGLLFAISDEFHQAFVPGRTPSFRDVMIDFSGILIGVSFVYLVRTFWLKKKYRSE